MFAKVAPGVFSVSSRFVEGKSGIVIGTDAVLAIDACNYPDEGQAMVDFIRSSGRRPDRLALTHGHGDHILGSGAFKGAEVYAHALTPGVIRRQLARWAERSGESLSEVESPVIWPTVTFNEMLHIDLGGRRVRLFHAPGHSEDAVCAYVEESRVLFGGDTVVTGIVPAIGDGDSVALEATLRGLSEMVVETLVPGHGSVLHGAERVHEWICWWSDYLSKVRTHVRRALERGESAESVAEAVGFQDFVGDRLPADKHNMPQRHRNTVDKIIEEEITKLGGQD